MYSCTYYGIAFQWDAKKAAANLAKHRVDFADAVEVLFDPEAITVLDQDDDHGEERFVSLGTDGMTRILVLFYSWRGEAIRIISARKATRRERRQYKGLR